MGGSSVHHQDFFVAVVAALGTAIWAMLLSRASFATALLALIFVGCLAAVATFCAAILNAADNTKSHADVAHAAVMALVFAAYQSACYAAFTANGALAQAVVNCNIVFIVAHTAATGNEVITADTLATAGASVIYIALGAFIAFYK